MHAGRKAADLVRAEQPFGNSAIMGGMSSPLLLSRRFAPLFWCQFFAAFNDNFLKTALVFVILFQSNTADLEALITFASAVFIAPFFFLSALGGELADRYDKAKVAQRLKFVEIFIAALAVWLCTIFAAGALHGAIRVRCSRRVLWADQNTAFCRTICGASGCRQPMRSSKVQPSLPYSSGRLLRPGSRRASGETGTFAILVMVFSIACWISRIC